LFLIYNQKYCNVSLLYKRYKVFVCARYNSVQFVKASVQYVKAHYKNAKLFSRLKNIKAQMCKWNKGCYFL